MAQIAVAGAGNANENINLINPRFQAEALRQIRGYDVGVLKNTFFTSTSATGTSRTANPDFMWKLNISGGITAVRVGRGMATAYGYDIQSEAEVTLAGTIPASGTKYVFVYLEWDLHNPNMAVGSIKLRDNGTSSSWTPSSQNNLITNPTGIYQMILYRLTVNASGTITATANWENFGVKTIGYNLRSEHANHTEQADYSTKAKDYDTSTGSIKTKFENIEARLVNLGFRTGSITLPNGSATTHKVDRQGNYCILTLKVNYTKTGVSSNKTPTGIVRQDSGETTSTWTFTIPANLRPKTQLSFKTAVYKAGSGYGNYAGAWATADCTITTAGVLTLKTTNGYYDSWLQTVDIYVGYEAPAIT